VKGTKTQTSKKEGKEFKNPDTTRSMRGYSPGERKCKRKKNNGEIFRCGIEERENRYWMERGKRRCSYGSCA
jgi:hypothetical protein